MPNQDSLPLPRATPERPPRTEIEPTEDAPEPLSIMHPSLSVAADFRLQTRHIHSDEGQAVTVAVLVKGGKDGDSPGKSMMVLNGFVAKGQRLLHSWVQKLESSEVLVMVFGNVEGA